VEETVAPCCPAPPRLHEVLFRKSFRACEYRFRATEFFHPFQPGIHIHIASESVFTSLRNDYSHAPESAPADDPEITDEMWTEAVRRGGYKGPIILGKDLLEI